ncbi:uncharacterized protein [Drosophila virilis]|uniref:HTH CENPB-type domain-containing protein n=1 Tax=Drosophila virilis TaxID=7244 RepID=B4LGJ9_DROVI|nr:uncharacterized protein LOC6623073 [Drosophila virilis]EDW69437.1 uncharacterized protein Dvir_GJ13236 [Drosophila virilis]
MSDDEANRFGGSAGSCSQRIRNVLTLEERVEVIRQYDIMPMYSKLAKNFNCSWEQIKSIILNREPIMEFYEATRHNNRQPNSKFEELRRRKINFLGHCLYEYIQRAQFHLGVDINEELIRTKALEFQTLMGIEHFVPHKSWINHFKAAYNITLSNRQITMTRKPPRSLELRDIMSYCGKNIPASDSSKLPDLPAPPVALSTQQGVTPLQVSTPAAGGRAALLSPRKPVDIRSLYRTKTLVAASSQNQATLDELQLRRKRKINFLEKALFEYISRSQFHHKNKGRLDVDHLREVAINLRDILKIENFFPDRTWFNHFKSHYNFSFSQGVHYNMMLRRVPLSLDLRDIVSYCGRHEQREQSLGNITLTPKETQDAASFVHVPMVERKPEATIREAVNVADDDDDCVAIETPTELIEIQDDDDEQERASACDERRDLKRPVAAAEDSPVPSLPLKIQKIESLNPSAHSPGHYSEDSADGELPRCVESYKDALRLLKPLEEFALLEENYRAIGLLTQLEKIFEGAANRAQNDNDCN